MSAVHIAAKFARSVAILTGADRILAETSYQRPHKVLTRLFRPDINDYRGTPVRRALRNGITFDLDLADYVEWTIYFGIESDDKAALFDLVRPGDVVLDIGTNVGEVALNFAKRVGRGGKVIGFEPNPRTLAKCRHNLSLNAFENIELHQVALGESAGEVLLGHPQELNAGADRIVASGGVPVRMTTLDSFGFDRVNLIKIDVEGLDLKVLRGAEKTIERCRPQLFVELSDINLREQGDSAPKLVEWLRRHNYRMRDAVTGKPIRSSDDIASRFSDIVAVPITPPPS